MNPILAKVIDSRNGHYVHALEVSDVYELQSYVESLTNEFLNDDFNLDDIIDFFQSMTVYALNEENEEEVWDFDAETYIIDNF